jgi:hypothetical protein
MPIRINLLAEAQALEEQRRRDPVKRVILAGIVGVAVILAYSSSLFVKSMVANSQLSTLEGNLNSRTNEYRQIIESQRMLLEGKQKLEALHQLATNRFLVGNLLNALQKIAVDNVQLVRLKIDQTYLLTEAAKPKSSTDRSAGKPATATEKIVLTLNAKDTSSAPGSAVNYYNYQEALSTAPYFQEALGKTNGFRLANLGTPQADPDGKPFVLFTLEARFPEKTR